MGGDRTTILSGHQECVRVCVCVCMVNFSGLCCTGGFVIVCTDPVTASVHTNNEGQIFLPPHLPPQNKPRSSLNQNTTKF